MVDHAQAGPIHSGGFRGFLQRRLAEAVGAALIILGLGLLLAFISANAGDPSFNRAVDQPTRNLMGPLGAYIVGLAFAVGWTPCIGPVLAAVLAVAGSEQTVTRGAGLLAVYSLGLGLPDRRT